MAGRMPPPLRAVLEPATQQIHIDCVGISLVTVARGIVGIAVAAR